MSLEDDDPLEPEPSIPEEPEGAEEPATKEGRRRRLESILPFVIKRAIEAGIGTISKTDDVLKGVVGDVKLPREVAHYLLSQVDETKNVVVRAVAREFREFLQQTDLATELQKVLTALSFEIKTEIRFIPNDAGTGIKPNVKATAATVKRTEGADAESGDAQSGDKKSEKSEPPDAAQPRRGKPSRDSR